jgi:hypothetical protein
MNELKVALDLMRQRRVDRTQLRLLIARAPRAYSPLHEDIEELAAAYGELAGNQPSSSIRNLLALVWEIHGPDSLELLRRLWSRARTTNNLLAAMIRLGWPDPGDPAGSIDNDDEGQVSRNGTRRSSLVRVGEILPDLRLAGEPRE